jgi:HK97 family phage prohead protease
LKNKLCFSAIVVKSVNEEKREIAGTASTPQLDRVNDVVEPKGLTFNDVTPLLLNHNHSQPVGTVRFGQPTDKGLPFTASIAKVDEPGVVKDRTDEAWHSVKSGLIKGVSIGFIPKESKPRGSGATAGVHYTKAAVHELSLVAIPANPGAVISAFKGLDHAVQRAATINGRAVVCTYRFANNPATGRPDGATGMSASGAAA